MTTSTFQSSVFEGLQSRIAGEVLLPESSGYARLGTPWNVAMASARPVRAVVAVADSADIAATVRFAADHGLRVAVQRTGHGAVPFASEDVVLVHTARLGEVSVDPAARTARVGAGALWQNVLDAVTPYGLAPICGSSATIGVAGYLTGAGIGPLVRTYGVSSDHVRAFDLVTGDGDVLHVTPDEHSELFWGLRGGKASLGIVASAELDLVELTSFHGGTLYFDGDDAAPRPSCLAAGDRESARADQYFSGDSAAA
jgi:FAD/FMN-containing dehydrogenase